MATITQRGKTFVLNWTDLGGTRQRKSLGKITRKQANIIKQAKELELATGESPLQTNIIFDVFIIEYSAWFDVMYPASADRTEEIIRIHLLPYFAGMPLSRISVRHGEQYIAMRIKEGGAAATIIKELNKLRAILNKAVIYKYIKENPLRGLEDPADLESKPARFYTVTEINKIFESSPNHAHWWRFIVNTGIRRKEAFQLKNKHIVGDAVRILSTTTARTKSRKWREVPMNNAAKEALTHFKAGSDEDYIFPRINIKSISRAFKNDLARAGLDGSIHCLRHTFCSHLVMNSIPLRTVQVLAGHSTYKTTEKYAHLAPDHLKDATLLLEF